MKKLLTGLMVFLLTITGCSNANQNDKGEHKLDKILLSGDFQTTFEVDSSFNYDGLIVTAYYEDDTSQVVTNYEVTPPNMHEVGTVWAGVSYTEEDRTRNTLYMVNIVPQGTFKPALDSITLSGNYKTVFYEGEAFTYDGLIVTAHYVDGTSKEVTDYTVDTAGFSPNGGIIIVEYREGHAIATASYNVEVISGLPTVFKETYLGRQYYLNHIGDIYSVWKKYRGRGVTIAVIDKAFDAHHEDFYDSKRVSKISGKSASISYNGSSITTNVGINYVQDLSDSHGTFCAGVAAASLNNKGVIGVAPDAELLLIKVDGKPKSIANAFRYAADNGAKVITISIGSYYNYEGDLVDE